MAKDNEIISPVEELNFDTLGTFSRSSTTYNLKLSSVKKCQKGTTEFKTLKYEKQGQGARTIWENGRRIKVIVKDVNGRIYNKDEIKKLIGILSFSITKQNNSSKYTTQIWGEGFNVFNKSDNSWEPDVFIKQNETLTIDVAAKNWATMSAFSCSHTDGSSALTIYEETDPYKITANTCTVTWTATSVVNGNAASDYIVFYITLNHIYSDKQVKGYFTTDNSGGFFDFRYNMTVWLTLGTSPNVVLNNMYFQLLIDDTLKLDTDSASINDDKLIMSTGKNISTEGHTYTMRCAPKSDFIDWTAINVYSYSGYFETSRSNVPWGGRVYSASGSGGGGGSGGSGVDPYT